VGKIRAALTHFGLSVLVVGGLLLVIFLMWYPAPYFHIKGAGDVIVVLVGVDVILGPLLTLIVYRAGKPKLMFDLSVIVLMQIAALVYGGNVIYKERPEYMVFAVDRFNIIAARDVYWETVERSTVAGKPISGPLLMFSIWPEDETELSALNEDIMFGGTPDLEFRPRYWHPYEDSVEQLRRQTNSLRHLQDASPDSKDIIDQFVESNDLDISRLNFAGVIGRTQDFAMVFDRETGRIVGAIEVMPWVE